MTSSRSKLGKHRAMMKAPELVSALPRTRRFTKSNLFSFLSEFGELIAKPTGGYGGDGVISVLSLGGESYRIQDGNKKLTVNGAAEVYTYLSQRTKGMRYLVQRKISLAQVDGRPFDIRVMVQRKGRSGWTVTGHLAKIAGPGYIITNIRRSKGRVAPVLTAIRLSSIEGASADSILQRIQEVSLAAVRELQKHYRIRTVGVDIGVDGDGKVWIIEANFKPDVSLFRKLKDKTMYKRIQSYKP